MSSNLDIHRVQEVTVLVPSSSPDSSFSISTGSPTLLGPGNDIHANHGTLTVKFAPLPQIKSKKKRSLAPVGASAHLRRKRVIQKEEGSKIWSAGLDMPDEDLEDPIVLFAKFVKKTGQTLWQRVRKENKVVAQENNVSQSDAVRSNDAMEGRCVVAEVVGGEVQRSILRQTSWSPGPSGKRRTLDEPDLKAERKSTSDLVILRSS